MAPMVLGTADIKNSHCFARGGRWTDYDVASAPAFEGMERTGRLAMVQQSGEANAYEALFHLPYEGKRACAK